MAYIYRYNCGTCDLDFDVRTGLGVEKLDTTSTPFCPSCGKKEQVEMRCEGEDYDLVKAIADWQDDPRQGLTEAIELLGNVREKLEGKSL